jgi:hypothetical protein
LITRVIFGVEYRTDANTAHLIISYLLWSTLHSLQFYVSYVYIFILRPFLYFYTICLYCIQILHVFLKQKAFPSKYVRVFLLLYTYSLMMASCSRNRGSSEINELKGKLAVTGCIFQEE